MKSFQQQLLIICLFLITSSLTAQDLAENTIPKPLDTDPPVTERIAEVEDEEEDEKESPFGITGFVDAYYQYSFNESPFPTSFTESHNSFTLGMANVVLSKEGKVGFVADLAFGPRAEVANGYNGTTLAVIKQLFVTYSPVEDLTFTFGNFGTHVGYEVIDAPANINYSTSYMFSNGPFYHTGLKADYAINENFGVMVGLFNDTDEKFDFVEGKHFGAQLSYTDDQTGVFLNFIGGKDDVVMLSDSVMSDIKGNQIDLTATFQATEQLGLGVNATTKIVSNSESDDNSSWMGAALYANYAFSDAFTLGFRGEYIGDDDGLLLGAADNSITAFTLSGNFKVGPLTIIPEFRIDNASKDVYVDKDGMPTGSSSAVLCAVVYAF